MSTRLICDLDSDVAESSKDPNETNQSPKPIIKYGETRGQESTKEIEKRTVFDHDTLNQEKHDGDVTDSTSTGRPACGSGSTKRYVATYTCSRRSKKYGETRIGGPKRGARN